MGREITPGCEVRLKRLKMEELLTTRDDANEVFEKTEVLHSQLPYTLIPFYKVMLKKPCSKVYDLQYDFLY